MQCERCGTENPARAKFCIECGTALQRRCAQCGGENAPQAKFCGQCGGALTTPPQTGQKQRRSTAQRGKRSKTQAPATMGSRPALPTAERRQLTVQFIDL